MLEEHTPSGVLPAKECETASRKQCATSSFRETGLQGRARLRHDLVSRYVAEQRDMLIRTQGMESGSHCASPSLGEMIR